MQAPLELFGSAGLIARRIETCLSVAMLRGVLKAISCLSSSILLAGWLVAGQTSAIAQAITSSEYIISDPQTGAALGGYDPVAYFLEGRALLSQGQHRAYHGGKLWFFTSGANRAAFLDNPAPFLPVFGGYDPLAITRGSIVSGSPDVYLIHGGQLYLFRNKDSRAAFLATPTLRADAERVWPEVRRDLSP